MIRNRHVIYKALISIFLPRDQMDPRPLEMQLIVVLALQFHTF